MPPTHTNRTNDVHALLDTVRASGYAEYDEATRGSQATGADDQMEELLRQVRAHFIDATRGRDTLANAVRELEGQLQKATADIAALKQEREHLTRLKGLYERKFQGIRELAQQ